MVRLRLIVKGTQLTKKNVIWFFKIYLPFFIIYKISRTVTTFGWSAWHLMMKLFCDWISSSFCWSYLSLISYCQINYGFGIVNILFRICNKLFSGWICRLTLYAGSHTENLGFFHNYSNTHIHVIFCPIRLFHKNDRLTRIMSLFLFED